MENNPAEKVDKGPLNQGLYVLFAYNWECKSVRYTEYHCSRVSNVLKSTKKQQGLSKLSAITRVSTV